MGAKSARDPTGQTLVFELNMRLFFVHVLGVRPDSLPSPHVPRGCTAGTREEQ